MTSLFMFDDVTMSHKMCHCKFNATTFFSCVDHVTSFDGVDDTNDDDIDDDDDDVDGDKREANADKFPQSHFKNG